MKFNINSLKIKVVYFTFYSSLGAFFGFIPVFLRNKGYSYTEVGILLALLSILRVFFQPIWGHVSDKFLGKKTVLIISIPSTALTSLFLIGVDNFIGFLLVFSLFLFFYSGMEPIIEAYCFDIIHIHTELEYGKVRLMGSLGFAIVSFFTGYLTKAYGINSMFYLFAPLLLISLIFIFFLPKTNNRMEDEGSNNSSSILEILKNKSFILFLFIIFMLNIATNAGSNYMAELITFRGGDTSNLGLIWFVIAMSEIPTMFFATKLIEKFGVKKLLLFSMFIFSIRFFLDGLIPNFKFILLIQLLQMISFAILAPASIEIVNKSSSKNTLASAISIYFGVQCMGSFFGVLMGGIVIENHGVIIMYYIISAISLIAMILCTQLKIKLTRN